MEKHTSINDPDRKLLVRAGKRGHVFLVIQDEGSSDGADEDSFAVLLSQEDVAWLSAALKREAGQAQITT